MANLYWCQLVNQKVHALTPYIIGVMTLTNVILTYDIWTILRCIEVADKNALTLILFSITFPCGASMSSFMQAWTNYRANRAVAGDLKPNASHVALFSWYMYIMYLFACLVSLWTRVLRMSAAKPTPGLSTIVFIGTDCTQIAQQSPRSTKRGIWCN